MNNLEAADLETVQTTSVKLMRPSCARPFHRVDSAIAFRVHPPPSAGWRITLLEKERYFIANRERSCILICWFTIAPEYSTCENFVKCPRLG